MLFVMNGTPIYYYFIHYFRCVTVHKHDGSVRTLVLMSRFGMVSVQREDKSKHIYIYIYIQCPPLILAPLVNMSKGGCENKSALFILFIFHSKNSQNSNLSLK